MSLNATLQQMEIAIDEFTGGVRPGDISLFFYSGHGMQISEQNYLVPVDFQARTTVDAKYKAYPAQRVQENLEAAGAGMQILIWTPAATTRSVVGREARMDSRPCKPGGAPTSHSPRRPARLRSIIPAAGTGFSRER